MICVFLLEDIEDRTGNWIRDVRLAGVCTNVKGFLLSYISETTRHTLCKLRITLPRFPS
jgi:hypothetical protein